MRSRAEILAQLARVASPEILIIGGGINGIGLLRDLAAQGIGALLVERGDFCSGTSAAPSRLIHGGLRYLETGEFALVRESLVERNRLLINAPHTVRPIRVWVPVARWGGGLFSAALRALRLTRTPGDKGGVVLKLGLVLYDLFGAMYRTMPRHRFVAASEWRRAMPTLAPDTKIVAEYYDARVTMPERLGLEIIDDAERACPDSCAVNYCEASGVDGDAIVLTDTINRSTYRVRPKIVVNCAGAWLDGVDDRLGIRKRLIGGTKGSHLVLRRADFARELGDVMLYFETPDHRACLAYALDESHVLLGTTDIRTDDPDDMVCSVAEVDYLFDVMRRVTPRFAFKHDDIVFAYAGVRPLPLTEGDVAGAISRDHVLRTFEPTADRPFAVLSLVGGKWTTYRACAEQMADAVLKRLDRTRVASTEDISIGGGRGCPATDAAQRALSERLAKTYTVTRSRADTLIARYGSRAEHYLDTIRGVTETMLPTTQSFALEEIVHLAATERVTRLNDLVLRRTSLALLGDASPVLVGNIGEAVGSTLGWPPERVTAEIAMTNDLLRTRHWTSGRP